MNQNENPCKSPMVELPVCSLKLSVSKSAFDGIGGGGGTPGEGAPLSLKLGVETKTNTYYMGKPVYTQLFNYGEMPNKGVKAVPHGIADVDWIQVNEPYSTVFFQDGNNHPIVAASPDSSNCWYYTVGPENVTIFTGRDRRVNTAMICLQYTKTTDEPEV